METTTLSTSSPVSHHTDVDEGIEAPKGSETESAKSSGCWLDELNDDVLSRIFRAVVGRPTHFCYPNLAGVPQDPYDDFFGDRRGIFPTQNPGFSMAFVLPRVCRRWRHVMKKFPSIWSRASVTVKNTVSTVVPLTWWCRHGSRLESLYLDGHSFDGLGNLSAMHIGTLSLLSIQHMRALCLVDCFEDGAARSVLASITSLSNLIQLQVYRASQSFVSYISLLTNLQNLKTLELGYCHSDVMSSYTEASTSSFPLSLERLALCEVLVDMDLSIGGYLTNLRSLKLMSTAVVGRFCEHLGNLPFLTKLVVDDSLLEGGGENNPVASDFLPEDLHKVSALANIKDLSIQGLDCGRRGYFEWLGEEILRDPPFTDLHSLSLCFSSLGVISDAFADYQNLRHVYIAQIRFETIPDPILSLSGLVRLEMISCDIVSFPEVHPCCSDTIVNLNLCGNKLKVIPKGLCHWKNLETIELADNPTIDFANIECLLELTKLKAVTVFQGEKALDLASIDIFCQEFAHMSSALKLGYVCAKLSEKTPFCRVFL